MAMINYGKGSAGQAFAVAIAIIADCVLTIWAMTLIQDFAKWLWRQIPPHVREKWLYVEIENEN